MTDLVLPNDANVYGHILGGKVMHLVDLAAAMTAFRHCRRQVVTVSVDSLRFLDPVRVGDLILLEAVLTRSFRTSMEVQVEVRSEGALTGERKKTCSAFLTFVAIDEKGIPSAVPPLIPVTDEEKLRYEQALARRESRLKESGKFKDS
jgi:acyl-CoA hydrolase